jgi:hypothetical protein
MEKKFPILIIILILIFLTISVFPNVAGVSNSSTSTRQLSSSPKVVISLNEYSQTISVRPNDNRNATFTGKVTVEYNLASSLHVRVTAIDTWGSAICSPSLLIFTQSGEQSFVVSVQAPPRESANTIANVTVKGAWYLDPGTLTGDADPSEGLIAQIKVAQFYEFLLRTKFNHVHADPDSEVKHDIFIQNLGNGEDLFSIKIKNPEMLTNKNFEVSVSQSEIKIPKNPGESRVLINIKVPPIDKEEPAITIEIEVCSEYGRGIEKYAVKTIKLRVEIIDDEVKFRNFMSYSIAFTIILILIIILIWWRGKRKGIYI